MMQNPVLVMSLSGTIAFLMYILLYPITKKYCTPRTRYLLLKISMLFYLLPLPYYKFRMIGQLRKIFPDLQSVRVKKGIIYLTDLVIYNKETVIYPFFTKIIYVIAICSGILSAIILILHIFQYIRAKKVCMGHTNSIPSLAFKNELAESGIKRKITFAASNYYSTPFTLGILSPVIVIPEIDNNLDDWSKPGRSYVIKHELIHIKNRDALTKFLSLAVIALHWYNPVCYLLYHEIKVMCEICCDTEIVSKLSVKEQKKYFTYLINLSSVHQTDKKYKFSISFKNNSYQMTKRRIQEIDYLNRKKKKPLTIFAAAIVCSLSVITTFAYQPPVGVRGFEIERIDEKAFLVVTPEGEVPFGMEQEYIPYDCFITDEYGNIYKYEENAEEKADCIHQDFEQISITYHERMSNGVCKISIYSANKCISCEKIMGKSLINRHSYEMCPH